MKTLTIDIDADGIALLTIDVPDQSMNVIGPEFITDLGAAIDRISGEDAIKGPSSRRARRAVSWPAWTSSS